MVSERGHVLELIQVAYEVSNPKTLTRELTSLVEASKKTGCKNLTLVACTDSRTETVDCVEIKVVSAVEWLLNA